MKHSQENFDTYFPPDGIPTTCSLGEPNCEMPDGGILDYDSEKIACDKFLKDTKPIKISKSAKIPKPLNQSPMAQERRRKRALLLQDPLKRKQYRASDLIRRAIERGKIKKPEQCELCGNGGFIDGHHEDYDKPYDVVWVCKKCHKKIHFFKVCII